MNSKNTKPLGEVRNQGIWKRFFHTVVEANIPKFLLGFYLLLSFAEGQILIRIPEVNGNFFAGDVSAASVGMFLGFELLNMFVGLVVLYVNHMLRYKMNRNLRNGLWVKILHLKPGYYSKVSPSSLISRITMDSDSINTFVLDVVIELGIQIYYLSITVAEMSKISIKVGLILLAFMPITFAITYVVGRISLQFENRIRTTLSDFTSYMSEIVTVLPLLKSMNRQAYETKRGEEAIEEFYVAERKAIALTIMADFVHGIAGIGPELVIFLLGIRYLNDGTFDAQAWYMFYLYAGTFVGFCGTLSNMWTSMKTIQGTLYKVSEVLYEEEESLEPYTTEIIASGDILFDDVHYAYDENEVIAHASFTIKHNQINMLIGPSGVGKSTLLKLLERLYEPDSGRILTGGENIADVSVREWRKQVAYVSQSTPLFSGSIRENLLYGIKREVSEEEILQACRMTHLIGFIQASAEGLETEVGQFGSKLSGGQKQKISVARALLSDAKIMILDEPTASLDITSTHDVMDTMDTLQGKKTLVVVTHDLEVISKAQHLVVINPDHTIDEGSLNEIETWSAYYKAMKQGKEEAADGK